MLRLETNHRSSAPILALANRLMRTHAGALELVAAEQTPRTDAVPAPTAGTGVAPPYRNGASSLPPTLITPVLSDMTIKSISSMDGRKPSSLISARFQFKTAAPNIAGNNAASFTVSNIAPQSPRMNRNIWRCFETSIREWAVAYGDIHVVVGTLAGPRTIVSERDPDRVAVSVPSHFFAVVYRPAPEPSALAVLVPNEPGHRDIRDFTMTVAGLEAGTGYRFGLPAAVATKELDLTRWPTRVVAREYLGRLPEIDVQCPRAG